MTKYLESVTVRKEGDVNSMWNFKYSDGTSDNYYAIEGSAQNEATDQRVHEYDPKLDMLLELLIEITPSPDDECGTVDVELDRYLQVIKVDQQAAE